MEKVIFENYKGKYDPKVCEELFKNPEAADLEELKAQFYGYVFTEGYKNNEIPDMFNMDYWDELNQEYDSPQAELIEKVIESTGDGESPDTAYCVICVGNEYDFMERVNPYNFPERSKALFIMVTDILIVGNLKRMILELIKYILMLLHFSNTDLIQSKNYLIQKK